MPDLVRVGRAIHLELYMHIHLQFTLTVYHFNWLCNCLRSQRRLNETNTEKTDCFQLSIFIAFLKSELEKLTDMINDFFVCFATVSDISWVKIFF